MSNAGEGENQDDQDRTFEPSEKKIQSAVERGDLPRSQFLSLAIGIWTTAIVVKFILPGIISELSDATRIDWRLFPESVRLAQDSAVSRLPTLALQLFLVLGAGSVAVIAATHIAGAKIRLRVAQIAPKATHLSIGENLKRKFGPKAVVTSAKVLIATFVSISVCSWAVAERMVGAFGRTSEHFLSASMAALDVAMSILQVTAAVVTGVAIFDLYLARQRWSREIRMTREEMRQESREAEGEPLVKGMIREIMRKRSRSKMLSAASQASVVVVNPSHVAIALSYRPKDHPAPVVVAKGVDDFALQLKAAAIKQNVPVYEDRRLARALLSECRIGQSIPPESFRAVASILAFVARAEGASRSR